MITNRAIPVTDQIRNILLERITTDFYAMQGKLPSESELCREFSASRASVRTAIAALAERGYVIRRPGLGTFLSPSPRLEGGLERLESILSMAHKHNLPTRLADLDVSLVPADDFLCDRLSLNPGDEVTCVSRTILIGETPVSYQTDHVPTHIPATGTGGSCLQRFGARPAAPSLPSGDPGWDHRDHSRRGG